jgi:mRNA-degrading endonuclease RelE of RelBE toxin-antitoxin system
MSYELRFAPRAERYIDELAAYLREYDEELATQQMDRLNRILTVNIQSSPLTWSYFPLTGPPFRAYLFRVGRRTQYWIIYEVDEDNRTIDIVHFWNTRRDPDTLEL